MACKIKTKRLKWLAALLMLVAAMVMPSTAWAGTITPTKPTTGDGSAESPYRIGTAAELYWFAGLVNGDPSVCDYDANSNPTGAQQNKAANAVLTANITVNSKLVENLNADGTAKAGYEVRSWMPISPDANYSGTFDGDNHTISGLYYNVTSSDEIVRAGLFGRNAGTIKNVSVKDSYFKLNFGGKYCRFGILCGYNDGTIENCYNESAITLTGTVGLHADVGGICGNNGGNGIIKNCNNIGKVSSEASCSQPIIYVGGVCGINSNSSTIENSSNTGEVSGVVNVGGVCGYNHSGSTIESCHNTGNVSGTNIVGGVCGKNAVDYGNYTVTITNCYNTGAVSGTSNVGGVSGYNAGANLEGGEPSIVSNCYNTGAVSGTSNVGGVTGRYDNRTNITNCYNTGVVKGTSDVGGVIGDCNDTGLNVTNCYYLEGCNAEGTTFNITEGTSRTEEQFKSGEVCYLLNGSTSAGNSLAWYQNIDNGATDSYPLLDSNGHGKVYQCTPCTGVYSNAEDTQKDHIYPTEFDANGFKQCSHCEVTQYQPASQNSSNQYEIGNAGQLYWFAGLVNGTLNGVTQNKSANAVLTADIIVNESVIDSNGELKSGDFISWTPIGTSYDNEYIGTFNGQGHTISGLYFNDTSKDFVGLFGFSSNATIQNVGVVNSYFNGKNAVGAVCGNKQGGTIQNCYNNSTINGTQNIGGICGFNDGQGKILNCYNVGTVGNVTNAGGVCGYNQGGTITNCYYLSYADDNNGGKTEAQFNSGEVAYLLNEGKAFGTQVWGQQINVNDFPLLGSAYKVLMAAQDGLEGSIYWATFSNLNSNAELIDPMGDITVYNATVSDGTLTLAKRSNKVSSREGVLLKANSKYVNAKNISDYVDDATGENDLVATPDETKIIYADSGHKLYRLTYNSGTSDLGFYLGLVQNETGDVTSSDGSQLNATPNKAYLKVATADVTQPSGAAARGFVIPGDDGETTDIECISVTDDSLHRNGNADGIFDLQGRKVSKPTNGLYIKNNKKILIKN